MVWIFAKKTKTLFFGLFGPSWPVSTIIQKLGSVAFLTWWPANFMHKIRKNWNTISEILSCKQTDQQSQIHRILLQVQISQAILGSILVCLTFICYFACLSSPVSRLFIYISSTITTFINNLISKAIITISIFSAFTSSFISIINCFYNFPFLFLICMFNMCESQYPQLVEFF